MAERQIALLTGATGAIGAAIAHGIATRHEYEVVIAARNEQKARRVVEWIRKETKNEAVRFEHVDLSRKQEIMQLSARWRGPLHLLINCAATAPRTRMETPEGLEMQFAVNIMGYFWMIYFFSAIMRASTPARIVNVASYWAGDLDLQDLQFKRRKYNNDSAYRQSKQANRMLTVAFAARLKEEAVTVNACHPGDVSSTLSNNLGFGGHQNPRDGARTPLWLALSPVGMENTGRYFEHLKETKCRFASDRRGIEALFEICRQLTED